MRFQPLFSLIVACAMTLPLSAHADWPKGEREKYMDDCEAAAMQNKVSKSTALKHCDCSAKVIDKKFTKTEVEELNRDGPRVALVNRLLSEVEKTCGTAN
ncbi:hypothetical protein NVV94_09160 [Pseudomonas sp. LS1212]|uniref:hypothetical protein n=1 Tax=Pseudomonas sp. LS1212 TaxID=2972478 RepID=UPI00215BD934|nr:hypothetical protein [Pseudomonas sp. LS1212]UVJ45696.1 hypothetical protein NVV94_09160 [Pseudomonas sp. LS1212]